MTESQMEAGALSFLKVWRGWWPISDSPGCSGPSRWVTLVGGNSKAKPLQHLVPRQFDIFFLFFFYHCLISTAMQAGGRRAIQDCCVS